jgi:hypothetical protein
MTEGSEPDPTARSAPARERYDFSSLRTFDPASVTVRHRQIKGLLSIPAGHQPLVDTLGEPCGDPSCRYRAHELVLHPDPAKLLANHILVAEELDMPPGLLIEELHRDIYEITSVGAIAIADLTAHPILYRVPLTLKALRTRPTESQEWELVRIVRDYSRTQAIRLPLLYGSGEDLVLHTDATPGLRVRYVGSLQEVLPALGEQASSDVIARVVARLLRKT